MLSTTLLALALANSAPDATGPSAAECCSYPTLAPHVRTEKEWVPAGWVVEATAQGILEEGRRSAVALILRDDTAAQPDSPPDTRPRLLVVGFLASAGGYDLALQNHTLLPRLTRDQALRYEYELGRRKEDGSEAPGVDFHHGTLRVRLYFAFSGGMTAEDDRTYSFRVKDGRLLWIGYDSSVVGSDLGSAAWSVDFNSGKISLTSGDSCAGRLDVIKHCRWRTTWRSFQPKPLLSIEEVGSGLEFKPQELWPARD
jgi:hypothetical protein